MARRLPVGMTKSDGSILMEAAIFGVVLVPKSVGLC